MKYCKFIAIFITGMFIMPHIVFATFVSKECLNYIHIMEIVILVVLLVIGLWRKPKSKFGIMFVGMGVVMMLFSNDTVNGAIFCKCWGVNVGLICDFGIGHSIKIILKFFAIFMFYYYIGWCLSKLHSKFISKKTKNF